MSLIILGKVSAEIECQALLRQVMKMNALNSGLAVLFDVLGEDDQEVLEEINPTKEKFYFRVDESLQYREGTDLWNEAHVLAQQIFRDRMGYSYVYMADVANGRIYPEDYIPTMMQTRLGRFLSSLCSMGGCTNVSIALVDGGIETEFRGSAEECVAEILRSAIVPWDCSANTLYMWDCL